MEPSSRSPSGVEGRSVCADATDCRCLLTNGGELPGHETGLLACPESDELQCRRPLPDSRLCLGSSTAGDQGRRCAARPDRPPTWTRRSPSPHLHLGTVANTFKRMWRRLELELWTERYASLIAKRSREFFFSAAALPAPRPPPPPPSPSRRGFAAPNFAPVEVPLDVYYRRLPRSRPRNYGASSINPERPRFSLARRADGRPPGHPRISGTLTQSRVSETASGLTTERKNRCVYVYIFPNCSELAVSAGALVPVYSLCDASLATTQRKQSALRWFALCGAEDPVARAWFSDFEGYVRVPLTEPVRDRQKDVSRTHVQHVVRAEDMFGAVVSISLIRKNDSKTLPATIGVFRRSDDMWTFARKIACWIHALLSCCSGNRAVGLVSQA